MDRYIVCSDGIVHTGLSREEVLQRLDAAERFAPGESFSFEAVLSEFFPFKSFQRRRFQRRSTASTLRPDASYAFLLRARRAAQKAMCAQNFSLKLGNADLVSLTHPAVVRLYRYDARHGDNLVDILYHYCICDCNVAKTASAVYMHRNTISAKLAKIRSLLDLDLTNGRLKQRIIFSYKMLRYLHKYRRISITEHIRPD